MTDTFARIALRPLPPGHCNCLAMPPYNSGMRKHAQRAVGLRRRLISAASGARTRRGAPGAGAGVGSATYFSNADLDGGAQEGDGSQPQHVVRTNPEHRSLPDQHRAARPRRGALAHVSGPSFTTSSKAAARSSPGARSCVRRRGPTGDTATIEGGETRRVAKGDVILSPKTRRTGTTRSTERLRTSKSGSRCPRNSDRSSRRSHTSPATRTASATTKPRQNCRAD